MTAATTPEEKIANFLDGAPHAVVGASRDRAKYGNRVLRVYLQNARPVFPVNPSADEVEGLRSYPSLAALTAPGGPAAEGVQGVHGVSIITPPAVTETIVDEAIALGIHHLWMQPGAESVAAVARAEAAGIETIAGDACILVVLGYREK